MPDYNDLRVAQPFNYYVYFTRPYFLLDEVIRDFVSGFGVSERQWNMLGNNQRLGFFNIVLSIIKVEYSVTDWKVDWEGQPNKDKNKKIPYTSDNYVLPDRKGIQQDRVFFKLPSALTKIFVELKSSPFSKDVNSGKGREPYTYSSRKNVFGKSLQLSFTENGRYLEADVDIFNPNLIGGFGLGFVLHGVEAGINQLFGIKTDPRLVSGR